MSHTINKRLHKAISCEVEPLRAGQRVEGADVFVAEKRRVLRYNEERARTIFPPKGAAHVRESVVKIVLLSAALHDRALPCDIFAMKKKREESGLPVLKYDLTQKISVDTEANAPDLAFTEARSCPIISFPWQICNAEADVSLGICPPHSTKLRCHVFGRRKGSEEFSAAALWKSRSFDIYIGFCSCKELLYLPKA